jgi:energy-converting hydrogenase Eha subunit F
MSPIVERKIIRWIHIMLSIPILGYIYGRIERPEAVFMVRAVILPVVILSGLWMWKGYLVKKLFRTKARERETVFNNLNR